MAPMPIYEYACTACGERTEARQSFDDPPLEECPVCGGKLRKLYSPVGIVFKGSGFYSTDARSKSEAKKSTTSTSDKKDTKTEKKSESKASSSTNKKPGK
jgi:putative FmdB family regulatory protein